MPASHATKPASEIQPGDRVKVGCLTFTVATVEPQTRGPFKGQIALAGRHMRPQFAGADEQIPVVV